MSRPRPRAPELLESPEAARDGLGALWALLGCQATLTAGLALSFPFFAIYLNRDRGLGMGWVGFWLSLMLLASAAGSVVAGELCDLRGAKPVMLWALAWRGLLAGAMAAAIWRRASLPLIVGLHVAGGAFGHFFDPAVRAWIARLSAARRVQYFGYHRVAVNLGWAIGPAAGGFLAGRSYAGAFAVTAAFCAACAALLWRALPAGGAVRSGAGLSFRQLLSCAPDRRFLHHCACCLLIAVVMGQLTSTLSVHSIAYGGLSEAQVGLLFTVNGALVLLLMLPTSSYAGWPLTAALAAGCALYAVGYTGVGFARGFPAMAAAVAVLTLGEILVSPRLPSLTANLAPPQELGRYMGLQTLCFTVGAAAAPLLGGAGLQRLSPRWPAATWLAVGGLAAAAAAGFLRLGRRLTQHEEGLAA